MVASARGRRPSSFDRRGHAPGQNGVELARKVRQQWPNIGLVITSDHSLLGTTDLPDYGRFIAKAARPEVLLKVIEQAALAP